MAACHKSDKSSTINVTGSWNLKGVAVDATSIEVGHDTASSEVDSIVFKANYQMTDVTGNFKFANDSLAVTGLSYSASTIMSAQDYQNGIKIEDTTEVLTPKLSSVDVTFAFLQVTGKDSVTFPHGSIPYPAVGFNVPLNSYGATYQINGSSMTMYLNKDTTYTGYTGTFRMTAPLSSHLTLTFQKAQ